LPSDREADAPVGVQLVNARVRSRRSVAADLGEEDPDGEIARIVEEVQRLGAPGESSSRVVEESSRDAEELEGEKPEAEKVDDEDQEHAEHRPSSSSTASARRHDSSTRRD
jgi:hypothetical protein